MEFPHGMGADGCKRAGASCYSGAVFGVAGCMSDYMLRKMFFPAVVFAFGGGFFVGFVTAVYAAVTLFGTAAMPG